MPQARDTDSFCPNCPECCCQWGPFGGWGCACKEDLAARSPEPVPQLDTRDIDSFCPNCPEGCCQWGPFGGWGCACKTDGSRKDDLTARSPMLAPQLEARQDNGNCTRCCPPSPPDPCDLRCQMYHCCTSFHTCKCTPAVLDAFDSLISHGPSQPGPRGLDVVAPKSDQKNCNPNCHKAGCCDITIGPCHYVDDPLSTLDMADLSQRSPVPPFPGAVPSLECKGGCKKGADYHCCWQYGETHFCYCGNDDLPRAVETRAVTERAGGDEAPPPPPPPVTTITATNWTFICPCCTPTSSSGLLSSSSMWTTTSGVLASSLTLATHQSVLPPPTKATRVH